MRAIVGSLEQRVSGIEEQQSKLMGMVAGRSKPLATENPEIIIDPPPLVEHAAPRVEAVKGLETVLDKATWCAPNGASSSGKTQLALLLAAKRNVHAIWVRLADRNPNAGCGILDRAIELASETPRSYLYERWFTPKEVERLGLTFPSTFPVLFGKSAKLDPARLVGVELQSKLSRSFPKVLQETIRFSLVLES